MFLDTLNQNFCLIISCLHFPKKFFHDFHHNQNSDIIVKQTNPRNKDILHILKYKNSAIFETACEEIFFVSKIIEHKLMFYKHNNRHVLLYQIEKSFDACNGSYCPKLILYFDYCNT